MFSDLVLVPAERLARQLYWSWPGLRRWWRRHRGVSADSKRQQCRRDDLLRYLTAIGVNDGALVMVHARTNGLEILDDVSRAQGNAITVATVLLGDLMRLIGPTGTLVMPTHPKYQDDELESGPKGNEITIYDPRHSPCGVGLVNELFWRTKGVKRSLFPFNTLAASGSLADELLRDNLNERKPSPHGIDSGYYRICQRNGLVVSVGIPLRDCLTIAHVVEEVRRDWQIGDFFMERRYRVIQDGVAKDWTVRLRRNEIAMFSYCRRKMGRDAVAEGVIHEGCVGSVRVDWARAGDVFDFFMRKTAKRPYPYYGIWMLGRS